MLAPRDTAVSTEWRPLADLAALAVEWRALARRAAEPNVFYEPDFALPAARGARAGRRRRVGARRRAASADRVVSLPRRASALRPAPAAARGMDASFRTARHALGRSRIWQSIAAAGFLDHVADDARLPKLLLLACQVEEGPVAAAFAEAIARRGGRSAAFGRHQRALLAPDGDGTGYLDAALAAKKRKELRRQRRRLDEAGSVAFTLAREPAEVASALADFLALEARGWKGRAGTAAAQDGAIRQFIESAVAGLAKQGQARVARLASGDRTIAAGVLFTSGRGAWFWKIAHDESVARASPGVQLTLDLTDAILRDGEIDWCDSCATSDHAMIDSIWQERRTLTDHLIALEPGFQSLSRAGLRASVAARTRRHVSCAICWSAANPAPAATAGSPCRSWSSASRR